ncbi:hypothetical protein AB0J35_23370 [Nonomuraea angiospora]
MPVTLHGTGRPVQTLRSMGPSPGASTVRALAVQIATRGGHGR